MANRKSQRLNDIIAAYRMVFHTDDGEIVLDDLEARFFMHAPTFVPGDPYESAYLEGQRSVILTILSIISEERNQQLDKGEETDE